MSYTLQFNKTDTLATTLLSGATSTTLTTGNFGSPSGVQLYVVDWDVPAKAEIISASVSNTSVTGITRGLTGGSAATTDHQVGAKIASIFVPQHYQALVDGTGWSSNAILLFSGVWTSGQETTSTSMVLAQPNSGAITCPAGKKIRVRIQIPIIVGTVGTNTRAYVAIQDNGTPYQYVSKIIPVDSVLDSISAEAIFTGLTGTHTFSVLMGNPNSRNITHALDSLYKSIMTVEAL
jgi:hypothetical protein